MSKRRRGHRLLARRPLDAESWSGALRMARWMARPERMATTVYLIRVRGGWYESTYWPEGAVYALRPDGTGYVP